VTPEPPEQPEQPPEFTFEVDEADFYGLGHRSEYEEGRPFVLKRRRISAEPTHPSPPPPPPAPSYPTCSRCGRAHFIGPSPDDPAYCSAGGVKL
jgi:hypothetical protein